MISSVVVEDPCLLSLELYPDRAFFTDLLKEHHGALLSLPFSSSSSPLRPSCFRVIVSLCYSACFTMTCWGGGVAPIHSEDPLFLTCVKEQQCRRPSMKLLHFQLFETFLFLFQKPFSKQAVDHVQMHLAKKQVPASLFQVSLTHSEWSCFLHFCDSKRLGAYYFRRQNKLYWCMFFAVVVIKMLFLSQKLQII